MVKAIKPLVLFLSGILIFPASADWQKIRQKGRETLYLDFDTMAVENNRIIIWSLTDLSFVLRVFEKGVRSVVDVLEIDCPQEKVRYLVQSYYVDQMGQGNSYKASMDFEHPWHPADVFSDGKAEWKAACGHEKYLNQAKGSQKGKE